MILQVAHPSTQDRDDAVQPPQESRGGFPFIEGVIADTAYAAERVADPTRIMVEIVRKPLGRIGCTVLRPRCWVVERIWGGSTAAVARSRTSRPQIESATAFLYAASVI